MIADRIAAALTRNDPGWLTREDGPELGAPTYSGARVSRGSALGLTTVWRCIDLISHAVSLAPVDVVVRIGGRSFPEYGARPSWLEQPSPSDPNYTGADHFGEAALSMLTDGNFFTWAFPYVWAPESLTLLDPSRVRVRQGPLYDLLDERGRVTATLTPMEVLHGWWMRAPGALRGISPLEALRQSLGSALAAEEFAGRFFGQGAALSFGVEVPGELSEPQKADLRDQLKRRHAGTGQSHAIGVLTRGAKFVPGLQPTPEQAQMLATRKFAVEDIARAYGVPPGMAGSQEPGASSYASATEWRKQFRDDAVMKFTAKLERQYARLLSVPPGVTAPGASVSLRFDLDWIARTDLLARYQANETGVRGGFVTPNEVRSQEGMAPLSGGDQLYMQQQMVPIGDLGRTKLTEPLAAQQPAGRSAEYAADDRPPMVFNVRMETPTIDMSTMPPPQVTVNVPRQPAPTVTVNVPEQPAPVVNVPEAAVTVNVPPQAAPTVTVNTPDSIAITRMPARVTRRTVVKRTPQGGIAETQDVEQDL